MDWCHDVRVCKNFELSKRAVWWNGDLKRKVEITEKNRKGKGIEYDNVKEQLEESEEAIMKLFDVNRKLVKSIDNESMSSDEKSALASDENGSVRRRST